MLRKNLFKKNRMPYWVKIMAAIVFVVWVWSLLPGIKTEEIRPVWTPPSDCAYDFNKINWSNQCAASQQKRLPVPTPHPAEIRRLANKIAELNPHLNSRSLPVGTLVLIPPAYRPSSDVLYYSINEDDAGGFDDMACWLYQQQWDRILNPSS